MWKKTNSLVLLTGFMLGSAVSLCGNVLADKTTTSAKPEELQALPFDELRTFTEIFGRIK